MPVRLRLIQVYEKDELKKKALEQWRTALDGDPKNVLSQRGTVNFGITFFVGRKPTGRNGSVIHSLISSSEKQDSRMH
jgi:hypothetical protein